MTELIDNQSKMTLWEHLEELRKVLLKIIFTILCFSIITLNFSEEIIQFLLTPSRKIMEEQNVNLILTGPLDAFWVKLKTGLISGCIISFPVCFYFIWQFISPALHITEKKTFFKFAIFAGILFVIGITLAYISIPIFLSFASDFTIEGTKNQWFLSNFISFCSIWILLCGGIAQTPLIILALIKSGILEIETLRKSRRYAIVIIFIISAILTPPDPLTQIFLALPLVILYEISIFIAVLTTNKMED
ncbi:MAG TPA: twin-arginine translocase subunit TatC [Victivallales bacterium]|nr:twin-arginine translocase subunit TatC [Victivallales bacterium]HPO90382.1 twin-arginine translocase subunit TatC [Victivallales bacterium]HRR05646.1 twin-arginine translocase subunit TatC [Victivallales bacterium]HRU01121.1 twin-arginine translocase subunit TatC [Victivallales bacterium]